MKVPEDWDLPSEGNDKLCARFSRAVYGTNPGMPYRLYTPKTNDRVPLVVYIHGADAYGLDNESQLSMHDIGTVLTKDSWQAKHPCFVLAPQCGQGSASFHEQATETICRIASIIVGSNPHIDTRRLYIYGYSAGAAKTFVILKKHPGLFAAAFAICGATDRLGIEKLADVPLYLMHAQDDTIVRASYKTPHDPDPVFLGSSDLYEEIRDSSSDITYKSFPVGYMKEHYGINPHCTWVPASEDEEIWEWMFKHVQESGG